MHNEFLAESRLLLKQAEARICHCVRQLSHEQIWWVPRLGQNSVGVVIRHVTGNLRQWAVCGFCNVPDDRDRDREFESEIRESKDQLLGNLSQVVAEADQIVSGISPEELLRKRTIQGFCVSGLGALMHTIPHLVGHTHQILTLTRLQLGSSYKFHWDPSAPRDKVPL